MWYKFTIDYGPGHQSTEVKYEFLNYEPDDEELEDHWDSVFANILSYTSQASGKSEKVDSLPEDVRIKKIETLTTRIKNCKEMLKQLQ